VKRLTNIRSRGQAAPVLWIVAQSIQFLQRQQWRAHHKEAACR
jgi:hypothetical protein